MSSVLKILVSRHSAFYSPLIASIAGGFLGEEGLDATYGQLDNRSSRDVLRSGEADVVQSAVSSNWKLLEKGIETDLPVHFAQINCRDGFFLCGRRDGFRWKDLEGATLLADHAPQPLAMLRFAAHCNDVDWERIRVVDVGSPEEIARAYASGEGDFAHLQSPAAHQQNRVLASVGASMPEVAFSSLAASAAFLKTAESEAFLRAYRKAREWVRTADAIDVAAREAAFFPGFPLETLATAIEAYQRIGCWNGDVAISPELYEQARRVFQHSGAFTG